MGRTQDLRAKLLARHNAQKPPPHVSAFVDLLNAHLVATQGFFVHTDNTWALALLAKSAGIAAAELPGWIAAQTVGLFKSLDKPPRWIGETGDTDWCFHEGEVLEFVTQFPEHDEPGEVYVFRGLTDMVLPSGEVAGKRLFYKFLIRGTGGSQTHTEGIIKA